MDFFFKWKMIFLGLIQTYSNNLCIYTNSSLEKIRIASVNTDKKSNVQMYPYTVCMLFYHMTNDQQANLHPTALVHIV